MRFQRAYEIAEEFDGWFSADEMELLYNAAKCQVPNRGMAQFVEIGSYRGRSAAMLVAQVNSMTRIVDPMYLWPERADGDDGTEKVGFGYRRKKTDFDGYLELKRNLLPITAENDKLSAFDLYCEESAHAAKRNFEVDFDLVHFDGSHVAGGIDVDAQLWLPQLRVGGLAAFHDFGDDQYPLVSEVVMDYCKEWGLFGRVGSLIILEKPAKAPDKSVV